MASRDSPIIVALDFPSGAPALALADRLDPGRCALKVGKELFTAEGPELVRRLVGRGFRVFLDLKFHDIPNTVAQACAAAARLGVWMLNVHATGGRPMLEAARGATAPSGSGKAPLLIAVTVLTSLDAIALSEVGVADPPAVQALRLARLAHSAGLDGVVCSGVEARELRAAIGADFCLVTPGIRPAGAAACDQARVTTPEQAIAAGANYLVIGRPITRAADPAGALEQILSNLGATP